MSARVSHSRTSLALYLCSSSREAGDSSPCTVSTRLRPGFVLVHGDESPDAIKSGPYPVAGQENRFRGLWNLGNVFLAGKGVCRKTLHRASPLVGIHRRTSPGKRRNISNCAYLQTMTTQAHH